MYDKQQENRQQTTRQPTNRQTDNKQQTIGNRQLNNNIQPDTRQPTADDKLQTKDCKYSDWFPLPSLTHIDPPMGVKGCQNKRPLGQSERDLGPLGIKFESLVPIKASSWRVLGPSWLQGGMYWGKLGYK